MSAEHDPPLAGAQQPGAPALVGRRHERWRARRGRASGGRRRPRRRRRRAPGGRHPGPAVVAGADVGVDGGRRQAGVLAVEPGRHGLADVAAAHGRHSRSTAAGVPDPHRESRARKQATGTLQRAVDDVHGSGARRAGRRPGGAVGVRAHDLERGRPPGHRRRRPRPGRGRHAGRLPAGPQGPALVPGRGQRPDVAAVDRPPLGRRRRAGHRPAPAPDPAARRPGPRSGSPSTSASTTGC